MTSLCGDGITLGEREQGWLKPGWSQTYYEDELGLLLSLPPAPELGIEYKMQDFLHDTTKLFLKLLFGFKIVSVCRYLWYSEVPKLWS